MGMAGTKKNGPSGDGPLNERMMLLDYLSAHAWLAPTRVAVEMMRVMVRAESEHGRDHSGAGALAQPDASLRSII
jgi:hypothetical protein